MTNLPQVPKLPYISGKTLFEDDEKAKEWFEILQKRKAVLCKLVRNTTASMYARNELTENEELKEFVIVSPCTDGVHKYQLTKFDKYRPVYDVRRDDEAEIVKEIPNSYGVVDVVE